MKNATRGLRSTLAVSLLLGLAMPAFTGESSHEPGDVFRDCPGCPEMIVVPAGSFKMGSSASQADGQADELPQHRVDIPRPLAVGRHEITRGQFATFVSATDYDAGEECYGYEEQEWTLISGITWRDPGFPQTDRDPVVCVSWTDAQAYLDWLSQHTGEDYRLLSESEWEYVARAGTTTSFETGNSVSHDQANYGLDADSGPGPKQEGKDKWNYTAPVGSFSSNGFGLYDMHGNVWEWVSDCYHENYQGAPVRGEPRTEGCSMMDRRGLRGGSWGDAPSFLRSAYRLRGKVDGRYITLGFRVARSVN